jgi:ligand-binding sensor domain-containing protein/signal transduction histidine kinase
LEDARGDLWIGAGSGLYRRDADGVVARYGVRDGLPMNFITSLLADRDKRIWVGTHEGLCKLALSPSPSGSIVESTFTKANGIGANSVKTLYQFEDGTLYVGTSAGLSIARDRSAVSFSTHGAAQGVPPSGVTSFAEDTAGNLWMGTDGGGAVKLARSTFLTYTAEDGLAGARIDAIFEAAGKMCVISRGGDDEVYVNEFDGSRFRATRLRLPPEIVVPNWGARMQGVAHDGKGNWWVGTSSGLLHYSGVTKISDLGRVPAVVSDARAGKPTGPVMAVYRDSAGALWISRTGKTNALTRQDPSDGTIRNYSSDVRWFATSGASLFAEDRSGQLWMGLLRFGRGQPEVARLRGNAFELLGGGSEATSGGIRAMLVDSRGQLWVGTNQSGLMQFDHPEAERPTFRRYTTAEWLSSDIILSLTEDTAGRIYAGTGSGVDRLDRATGRVTRYTSADGLAAGEVHASFRDRQGVLWFGAASGLSRLIPAAAHALQAPKVFITSLRVAGVRQSTQETGETEVSGARYQPNQNDLDVGFVSLNFAPGETLRYQYKLEGADSDWSQPSPVRTVNYSNLSHGSYRFLVRAVNSEGMTSERPAAFSFVILPPLWLRWWFQIVIVLLAAAVVYRLHRYRVKRLLDMERVRTRIATDLHDDIGSSLSQIAILSEVVRRGRPPDAPDSEPLSDIGAISRELVDSMGDIVWAIDPVQDQLCDLVRRMRRFAADVLLASDTTLDFRAPREDLDLKLDADLRRQTLLIFKEVMHNIVRHAHATRVDIALDVDHGAMLLRIRDNGRGFDPRAEYSGRGLRSMRDRARLVNAELTIDSARSAGSTTTLRVPLGRGLSLLRGALHKWVGTKG